MFRASKKQKQLDIFASIPDMLKGSSEAFGWSDSEFMVQTFNVSGRSIRMDDKLIGSNIACSNRYELIHDTLALLCKAMDKKSRAKLTGETLTQLDDLSGITGNKVVYRSNRDEVQQRMVKLGVICYKAYRYLLKKITNTNRH